MPHRSVVALQPGGLEPQSQSGQRRPQLVRRVADELALRLEHLAEPVGHLVEGDRDLLLLAGTGHLGARIELAVLDAARRARERAQRPGERAGEHPGEAEAERERRQADADDDEARCGAPARRRRRCSASLGPRRPCDPGRGSGLQ